VKRKATEIIKSYHGTSDIIYLNAETLGWGWGVTTPAAAQQRRFWSSSIPKVTRGAARKTTRNVTPHRAPNHHAAGSRIDSGWEDSFQKRLKNKEWLVLQLDSDALLTQFSCAEI
jgi:hypothetical protein